MKLIDVEKLEAWIKKNDEAFVDKPYGEITSMVYSTNLLSFISENSVECEEIDAERLGYGYGHETNGKRWTNIQYTYHNQDDIVEVDKLYIAKKKGVE